MRSRSTIRRLLTSATILALLISVFAGQSALSSGDAHAEPVGPSGRISDRNSDVEVAQAAYRDQTMRRIAHQRAQSYAHGRMTAKQATRSLNRHLGRYCASARLIGFALSDQRYNSATVQNFYHRSGCPRAPRVTHQTPRS
ncbi:MAG: hypothetical protein QM809_18060 [Gordonia sp. (in: high G+C Gram-positive bacteria)]|uniref:hypothetical protein n=1 Tax=Gordonia sp. (in: high G+C Gram-positive bacteria) TaxID=84139 RepID=UPI0039E647C3